MNYYTKLIDFFKRNGINDDRMFKYISNNITIIDYTIEEQREIRGLYPKYNKEQKLIGFILYIDTRNDETILLNIRPYIKAICAYYALGTNYKPSYDIEAETLAIHFEKLYLKENPDKNLQRYLHNIYTNIRKEPSDSKYQIALQTQEKIEQTCSNTLSFNTLKEKAKELRLIKNK